MSLSLGLLLTVLALGLNFDHGHALQKLRGVTIVRPPFVMQRNGLFEGYAIDLLNEIAKINRFEYSLYLSPDGKYGSGSKGFDQGELYGMIYEVYERKANFTVGDLEKNLNREVFIDFTDPFMRTRLSALINKNNVGTMRSFNDLNKQNAVKFGMKTTGQTRTFRMMARVADPVFKQMYDEVFDNKYLQVNSSADGVRRARTSKYAFIQEGIVNEYEIDQSPNCELTSIEDKSNNPELVIEYAIGVAKDSELKDQFNQALRQLNESGKLDQLKKKYWNQKCSATAAVTTPRPVPIPPSTRPTPRTTLKTQTTRRPITTTRAVPTPTPEPSGQTAAIKVDTNGNDSAKSRSSLVTIALIITLINYLR